MEKEVIRHYTNGELTIVWKPAACIHSKNCWNAVTGMPAVFDPRKRPWITMEHGKTAAIEAQVAKCPSGALSAYYNEPKSASGLQPADDSVSPLPHPLPSPELLTRDNVTHTKHEVSADPEPGQGAPAVVLPENPVHIRVMANGPLLVTGSCEVEDAAGNTQLKKDVTAFCRCGFSANKPYCDGSHVREGFQG